MECCTTWAAWTGKDRQDRLGQFPVLDPTLEHSAPSAHQHHPPLFPLVICTAQKQN
jgi:hypothetical protein